MSNKSITRKSRARNSRRLNTDSRIKTPLFSAASGAILPPEVGSPFLKVQPGSQSPSQLNSRKPPTLPLFATEPPNRAAPDKPDSSHSHRKPDININLISTELQELAGRLKIKVKLNKHLPVASSVKVTDAGYFILINPSRFRTERKLNEHWNWWREKVSEFA